MAGDPRANTRNSGRQSKIGDGQVKGKTVYGGKGNNFKIALSETNKGDSISQGSRTPAGRQGSRLGGATPGTTSHSYKNNANRVRNAIKKAGKAMKARSGVVGAALGVAEDYKASEAAARKKAYKVKDA